MRAKVPINTLNRIEQVVSLLSKYIDPCAYLSLLAPRISGNSVHSEKSRGSYIKILASLLQNAPLHRLVLHWQQFLSLLANESCIGTYYVGSRIQSESLKALAIVTGRMVASLSNPVNKTYHNCDVMKRAQELLLHNEDERARECSNNIARLLSIISP